MALTDFSTATTKKEKEKKKDFSMAVLKSTKIRFQLQSVQRRRIYVDFG